MPRILHSDTAKPQALILASDVLQDRKSRNVGFIARQIISAGLLLDCRGVLLGVPPADEARIAVAALDAHHHWDV
ncbi:hypothetical protein [Bradyrhizobium retamae]|uniref:hypothetical protein n=1 Tax=Bradyrhizobium retamae TaxID=1300035 RepID=UPI001FDA4B29|nr:hypothetical protein [Bradyrhizobium retamae]